jgi:hypothetical protein
MKGCMCMLISEVLKQVKNMEDLSIVPIKGFTNVRCLTSKHPRRFNVIGDINLSSGRFILYDRTKGIWLDYKKMNLKTLEEVMTHVKNDIHFLSNFQ